jgi:hypothetical protein
MMSHSGGGRLGDRTAKPLMRISRLSVCETSDESTVVVMFGAPHEMAIPEISIVRGTFAGALAGVTRMVGSEVKIVCACTVTVDSDATNMKVADNNHTAFEHFFLVTMISINAQIHSAGHAPENHYSPLTNLARWRGPHT